MTEDAAQPLRRRVLVNTAATGLGNGWAMVVAFVQLPILLGGLGPAAFGTWVLLLTFSATTGWVALADLGLSVSTTRSVAERLAVDDRRGMSVAATSGLALLVSSGVACAVLLATVGRRVLPVVFDTPPGLQDDLQFAIVAFSVQIVADLATGACTSGLEGLQRVDLSRSVDAARRTAVALATCTVALAGGGLRGVALASMVASILGALVAVVVLRWQLPARWHRPQVAAARELLRYGRSIAVLRPYSAITRTMDRLLVGIIVGPSAVALVEIATQIQNGVEAVLSASSYAVTPSASWLHARDDRGTLRDLLVTGTRYSMLATLPLAVGGAVLAGPFVHLWVGSEYAAAATMAALGLGYIAVSAPVQVGSNLLLGTGRAGPVVRAAGLAVAVNLVASIVLVRLIGPNGAFIGSILGALALAVPLARGFLTVVDTTWAEFRDAALRPALLPSAALGLVALTVVAAPLGDVATLLLGGGLGAAAYLAVAMQWSGLGQDLAHVRAAFRRAPAATGAGQPSSISF